MKSKQNITIITTILVISISLSAGTAYAEIPSWVKEVAKFWAAGHIDDDEYARTIEYLVTEEIISVPIACTPTECTPTKCTPTACTPTACTPTACTPTAKTVYTIHETHQCADLEREVVKLTSLLGIYHEADPEESHELYDYHIRLLKSIRASLLTEVDCTRADYPESWKRYDYWIDKYNDFINTPAPTTSAPTTTQPSTVNPNIVKIDITSCEQSYAGSDSIKMEMTFKNLDANNEYIIDYKIYVTDGNNNIITYDTRSYYTIGPDQTKFDYDYIRYSGDWAYCGIEITDIRFAR